MEEELTLLNAHRIHGNKWAELAKLLPGRYHSFMLTSFLLDKEIKEFYIFIWWTTQKEACPWILDWIVFGLGIFSIKILFMIVFYSYRLHDILFINFQNEIT